MCKFCLNSNATFVLLTSFIYLTLFSFAMGKNDNTFQNPSIFYSSFPPKSDYPTELNIKRSPVYDESTSGNVNEVHQKPSHFFGTPDTTQAVVAVVQAVNGNHQSSSEMVRSNSNNVDGVHRRCTYFENGEMRCTSRGDVLDNISSLINQAVSLAGQLGGLTGLVSQLGGLSGLMGLMGILGILGLKGIAGLLLPMLCVLFLKFLLILLPLKLLIPIPIISLPIAGRRNLQNTEYQQIEEKIATYLQQFISSNENIENISPKVTKMTKKDKLKDYKNKAAPSQNIIKEDKTIK